MEAPRDQAIEETKNPLVTAEEGAERQPVPGGKALQRLLAHLESRGLTEVADQAAATAVPDDRASELAEVRSRSSALPGAEEGGIPPATRNRAPRRGRRRERA